MIKDVFVLKSNSWHSKLMKYMWNLDNKNFSHICPYFWLSVFNVFFFIPYFIIRILVMGIIKAAIFIGNYLEENEEKWAQRQFEKIKNNDPVILEKLARMASYSGWLNLKGRYNKLFSLMLPHTSYVIPKEDEADWWHKLEDLRQRFQLIRYETDAERRQRINDEKIKRKQKINNILKVIKPISIALLWLVGAVIAGLAVWGTIAIVNYFRHITHKQLMSFRDGLIIIVSVVSVIAILIYVVGLSQNMTEYGKEKSRNFFRNLFSPFRFIGKSIASAFIFLKQMVSDNCPAIVWEDK
jgi:hypothetical protein